MPERLRVVKELASDILGHGIYWHHTLARPEGAQQALDEANARYVAVVEEVNWSRILLEAQVRCRKAEHKFPFDEWDYVPSPCAQCVKDELLFDRSLDRGWMV